MGLDEIIGLIGGSEPCYIIVLVALLGLAGRNRLHSHTGEGAWSGNGEQTRSFVTRKPF
jgi:hypothetical protein